MVAFRLNPEGGGGIPLSYLQVRRFAAISGQKVVTIQRSELFGHELHESPRILAFNSRKFA
jgi:hypothetical protein